MEDIRCSAVDFANRLPLMALGHRGGGGGAYCATILRIELLTSDEYDPIAMGKPLLHLKGQDDLWLHQLHELDHYDPAPYCYRNLRPNI